MNRCKHAVSKSEVVCYMSQGWYMTEHRFDP